MTLKVLGVANIEAIGTVSGTMYNSTAVPENTKAWLSKARPWYLFAKILKAAIKFKVMYAMFHEYYVLDFLENIH